MFRKIRWGWCLIRRVVFLVTFSFLLEHVMVVRTNARGLVFNNVTRCVCVAIHRLKTKVLRVRYKTCFTMSVNPYASPLPTTHAVSIRLGRSCSTIFIDSSPAPRIKVYGPVA